jgi:hypothetical protein
MCRMVARPPLAVSKPFSEYLTYTANLMPALHLTLAA